MTPTQDKRASRASSAKPMARDDGDWRRETLARIRTLILEADSEMIEERKWKKASIVPPRTHPEPGNPPACNPSRVQSSPF